MEYLCNIFNYAFIFVILVFSMYQNSICMWVLLRERAWETIPGIWHLQLTTSDLWLTLALLLDLFRLTSLINFFGVTVIWKDSADRVLTGFFFLGLSSYVMILAAMTLSHYVAVMHASCLCAPAHPKRCVLIASVVIWLVCVGASILMSVPLPFTMDYVKIVCIGIVFLVLFIIITFCWVHMLITIKLCGTNRHHQALRLSLGMIVVLFVTLVPYSITAFIEYLMVIDVLEYTDEMYNASCYMYTLPYLHCGLNPLLHESGAQRRNLAALYDTSSRRGDESHRHNTMAAIPLNDTSV